MHVARLSDAVAAILGLRVHGRIPVRVVEDDRVGAGQIDADAARARAQYEAEYALVVVEALHERLALLDGGRAVESQVLVAVVVEEVLEYVEHARHLGEDERAVRVGVQRAQQHVECLQLAAVVLDEALLGKARLHARVHASTQRRQIAVVQRLARRFLYAVRSQPHLNIAFVFLEMKKKVE